MQLITHHGCVFVTDTSGWQNEPESRHRNVTRDTAESYLIEWLQQLPRDQTERLHAALRSLSYGYKLTPDQKPLIDLANTVGSACAKRAMCKDHWAEYPTSGHNCSLHFWA